MTIPKVILHIGAPKSGTTWIQALLARHRPILAEAAILYPGTRTDHFDEVLDLLNRSWMGISARPNAWSALVATTRTWTGTVVISHELLSWGARGGDVQRCIESLSPSEVELVYTVRDLGRLLPSAWQEDIKNGCSHDFDHWLEALRDPRNPRSGFAKNFWAAHNPASVFSRWCPAVAPSNIRVVTVPPSGTPSDRLWTRFAAAVGIDSPPPVLPRIEGNSSMSWEETEVIRRINVRLSNKISPRSREHLVKRLLAHEVYGSRVHTDETAISVPESWHGWVQNMAHHQRRILADSGARIVGSLDDLIPSSPNGANPAVGPQPRKIAHAALAALAAMIIRHDATLKHGND